MADPCAELPDSGRMVESGPVSAESIPVPPLDGSRILASCSKIRELYRHPQAQLFGLFLFLVIFMGGIADGALGGTLMGAYRYVAAVANLFS